VIRSTEAFDIKTHSHCGIPLNSIFWQADGPERRLGFLWNRWSALPRLVGAIASFIAVAAVMYFTRKIDWYSSLPETAAAPKPPEALA
jgi:hypothetical protein